MHRIAKPAGAVLILAGLVTGLFWTLAWRLGSFAGAEIALDNLWVPAQSLHVLGAVLAFFGLIGLQAVYGSRTGTLGLIGFILSVAGAMCFFADGLIALVLFPALAAADAHLFDTNGALNSPPVFFLFVAFAVLLMFGYVLFAVALLRADQRMLYPAILLMAGAIVSNLPPGPVSPMLIAGGGVAWSAAMLWIGIHVRKDTGVDSLDLTPTGTIS